MVFLVAVAFEKSEHWGRFTEDFCPGYGTEVTDDTI